MTDTNPDQSLPEVDLTNCDREPIQFLGHVQAFGCLLSVSSDWMVSHASLNCQAILGIEAEALIGTAFVNCFPEHTVHALRTRLQILVQNDVSARIFAIDLFQDGRLFDVSAHRSGRSVVFEFEPHQDTSDRQDQASLVQALMARIRKKDTYDGFISEAARCLKVLLGMDRVMVYRFEDDGSGTVIAEALSGGHEPYLGLRYPASDIPKQARALYERNPIRIIADVAGENYPITPRVSPQGELLDLSFAVTRSVSPIHLEYLRNMGVAASMSVSILRRGKLWGLFACHHSQPINPGFETRTAVELFVQLFNYELAQLETDAEFADAAKARELHDRLMSQISDGDTLVEIFDGFKTEIEAVIPHDGIAVYSNGTYRAVGSTPTEEEFLGLARFLNTAQSAEVIDLQNIGERYEGAASFADRAAGLLALPISRTPRDYLVLFRRELTHSVKWAGNPQKPVEPGPNGLRLTPRKSFEAWQQEVRGVAAPWLAREKRAADALRVTLLEVVLKLTDEARLSRKKAQQQQELLIAELNHRVRNILNLIRGLVAQGHSDATTIEDYARVLDSRIHAMARAHDQLTDRNWSWVSLNDLIGTELQAFLSSKAGRVQVIGDSIDLSPQAFTTMALVIHELVTNSAKYGSLADSHGEVLVTVTRVKDGSATVEWVERNGPPVVAPSRKGFGTTIIERSVPYELRGEADVDYKITGLEARFMIPEPHVARSTSASVAAKVQTPQYATAEVQLSGASLVVEDNMIIAMDAADILGKLGSDDPATASRVSDALRIMDSRDIRFALLDVNLGDETTLPVAQECHARGIPFVVATGYGAADAITSTFPPAPILRKPYTIEQVQAAVAEALAGPASKTSD